MFAVCECPHQVLSLSSLCFHFLSACRTVRLVGHQSLPRSLPGVVFFRYVPGNVACHLLRAAFMLPAVIIAATIAAACAAYCVL